jgi:hypothetical protein
VHQGDDFFHVKCAVLDTLTQWHSYKYDGRGERNGCKRAAVSHCVSYGWLVSADQNLGPTKIEYNKNKNDKNEKLHISSRPTISYWFLRKYVINSHHRQ